jgi:hypothetical protein
LSFIHSQFVGSYLNSSLLEASLNEWILHFSEFLGFADLFVRRIEDNFKSLPFFRPAVSSSSISSSSVPAQKYLPEKTRFQFIRANGVLHDRFSSFRKRLGLTISSLNTSLQTDFRMKEEEATLLIGMTFLLVFLISLQLFFAALLRRRQRGMRR